MFSGLVANGKSIEKEWFNASSSVLHERFQTWESQGLFEKLFKKMGKHYAQECKIELFINFFVTSPETGDVLQTKRGVPSLSVVRQAISGEVNETDAAVYRIYDAVADRTIPQGPNIPNDQEFVNELPLIGQAVGCGEIKVEKAAENLQVLIEHLAVK